MTLGDQIIDVDRVRTTRRLSAEEIRSGTIENRLRALEDNVAEITAANAQVRAAGDNVLRDAECEYSHDAYDNDPTVGGDVDHLLAHWYHHAASDTLLGEADADLIKDSGHSGYAADDPDWDRVAGRVRLGTTRTVTQPLVNLLAQPGSLLYIQFTATLLTDTPLPVDLTFYVGVWDNTAGEEKWVAGLALKVIAVLGDGATAGTTATEYKAIIDTDKGEQFEAVMSVPLATAPDTLSAADFIRVSWPAVPGRKLVTLYRHRSGVYTKLAEVRSGSTEYDDFGDAGIVVGGFPAAALSALRARVQDNSFAPRFGEILVFRYAIQVPGDYAVASTQEQLLRLGLSAATTDAHQVVLDRFQLGFNYGGFQRGPLDLSVTNRVSVTDSPTGGLTPAPTGGSDDPPGPGSGGPRPREELNVL
jgi:hypothetical protein